MVLEKIYSEMYNIQELCKSRKIEMIENHGVMEVKSVKSSVI